MSESHSRPAPAWTLAALVVIGLWIDQHVPGWGQHAVDVVVWAALLFWMARSSRDTRTMLMVCVGWATAGEVFLSLVWGLYDYRLPGIPLFVPPAHAQQFHDAIAGSQLITFAETGHIPQEERPDESATAVNEFLHQVVEGSALAPLPEVDCDVDARC